VKRHSLCVFLLTLAIACQRVDRRAFQDLERTAKAIQTALDGTTTVAAYRELLNTYSAELATLHGQVTKTADQAVLTEFDLALKGLTDLRLVWDEKDARQSDMLPIREELAGRIAREYGLGVNTNEPPSIYANEALHAIWERAKEHLEKAQRLLGP
jgi:hypothetical protein